MKQGVIFMQIKAVEIRAGKKILFDNEIYVVTDFSHFTPGKGRAVVRTKLKNMSTGRVIDKTFSSQEKIELADLQTKKMQFLYRENTNFVFMDTASYEQITIEEDLIGESVYFLKENLELNVSLHQGNPIGIELPPKITLKVTETEPGVRGDTVSGATKSATLETGHTLNVPLFINEGDEVVVDTRDGKYEERA